VALPNGMDHVASGVQMELYPKRSAFLGPDELSNFSSRPIFNLITTITSKYVMDTVGEVKHRLSKESTVLVSCFGVGIMKKIFQMHFQDSMSRPTFCRGISGQSFWEVSESAEHKDNLASMLKKIRKRQPGFKVVLGITGQSLKIGPPILQNGVESAQNVEARKLRSRYLINTLLRAPFLGACEVAFGLLLFMSFKKLTSASVMGPMAVLRECANADLFANEAAREIGSAPIFEAWSVLRRHLPYLRLRQITEWGTDEVVKTSAYEQLHPMLTDVLAGKETDIDDFNG